MKPEHNEVLLTSFALNEIQGADAEETFRRVEEDPSAQKDVVEIRAFAALIEQALALESDEPSMQKAPRRNLLKLLYPLAGAAAAAFVLIFGLPQLRQKGEGYSVSVEADAFAATFSPGVDREVIRKVVQSHLQEIKKCYDDVLTTQPTAKGKVLVRFTYGAKGVVSEASIKESTVPSSAFSACIVDSVKSWKFPNAPNDVLAVVEYPFVFDYE